MRSLRARGIIPHNIRNKPRKKKKKKKGKASYKMCTATSGTAKIFRNRPIELIRKWTITFT